MKDESRNMNAHAAARVAACIWCDEYAKQHGGLMDFWDTLSISRKRQCKREAQAIRDARPYTG